MRAIHNTNILVLVSLMLAMLVSCGASQREKALQASFVTINAARDGFTVFDADRQAKIVAGAKSLEEGQAALAAYRKNRDKVLALFEGAYHGLAAALLAKDDAKTFAGLLAVMDQLKQAIESVKAGIQ